MHLVLEIGQRSVHCTLLMPDNRAGALWEYDLMASLKLVVVSSIHRYIRWH